MSTTGPDPRGDDPQRVRLSWPGDEPTRTPDPGGARRRPRVTRDVEDAYVHSDVPQVVHPLPLVEADSMGGPALRRAVVDAHDRLADRVLQRLRAFREDIDADLAELRSEMAALRQSVEDMGDRMPARQIRSSLEELRGDLAGLRRAGFDGSQLEHISGELAGLRSDLADLAARMDDGAGRPGPPSASPGPVANELAELRSEIASLRRRISLRVAVPDAGGLSDAQIEKVAEAVAGRLGAASPPRGRR